MNQTASASTFEHPVLVTGAAGFIGSHLCEALLARGRRVVGVDCFTDYYNRAAKESNLSVALAHPRFRLVEADLVDADLPRLLDGVGLIYHLAGQPGVRGSWGSQFEVYVRNNILAYGGESILAYSAQEEHLGVTFESNILLSHDMPILRNAGPERWTPRQTRFQRNLYWCEAGAPEFSRPTSSSGDQWADWRRDHDPDGVLADPLFVDPQRGDFRLRPGSPALAMGFVPFDISQCGPRPRPGSL